MVPQARGADWARYALAMTDEMLRWRRANQEEPKAGVENVGF